MPTDRDLLQIVDASLAEAVRRGGAWIACRPGCTNCCLGPFPITRLDEIRLRDGLARLDAERSRAIQQRAAAWDGGDDTPCPALDPATGRCELYEYRPILCRSFGPAVLAGDGSVGVCELCFEGAGDDDIKRCAVELDPGGLEEQLMADLEQRGVRGETTVAAALRPRFRAARTLEFTESVIREMTRLALQHGAVNLAQGFPDFPAPAVLKEAARQAIAGDVNQYAITWGARPFRHALAAKYRATYGLEFDPEREITVVCGSTEGMAAALLATTDPGDEIIIFEPFYENYGPDSRLCGAERRFVRLHPPHWTFDPAELRAAFSPRTKAVILNTPNNPTGKVFTRAELEQIAALCQEFDCLCLTDEIYEHIVYDGRQHIPIISLPGMRHRTLLVNSMSKTYSVTGWRVGWVIGSPDLTDSVRKVHDFLTVGAAAPLQQAGLVALSMPPDYYQELAEGYQQKRDYVVNMLTDCGFDVLPPHGAYYVMARYDKLSRLPAGPFARELVQTVAVAAVPGSSFFCKESDGNSLIRFCFCKKYETLELARTRLLLLRKA